MSVAYISEADRVRAALAAIPADDYTTWVDMAFAVKHGLGEAGFDLWDAWSQTAPNYDARSARATWRSASESGAITLASLFWLAREHGFDLAGSRAFGDRAARSASAHAPIVGADASLERKRRARRAAVARQALSIWNWARPVAPDHPYLARKQIAPLPTLRELEAEELHVLLGYVPKSNDAALLGRVLIVPVCIGHQISTLELIDCEGRKSSLAGGAKAGGWWSVTLEQHRRDACLPVLIAEGVATAVSAWQATGWYTLAVLSSGNLSKVATVWRAQHPKDALVILADLGAGFTHAEHAARNAHARLVVPRFASGAHIANQLPTDFNDMAVLDGNDAVGELLQRAVLETPAPTSTDAKASRTQTEGMSFYLTGDADMGSRKTDKGTGTDDVRRHAEAGRSDGDCASTQPSGTPEEGKQAFTHEPAASSVTETTDDGQHSHQGPRHATGELIYGLDAVPTEVKVAAERRFGAVLRMSTPRENGGPYRGEVLNTEHFLVQEVAPRSVVFHAKGRMTFVSDRLRWMDEHHRLNGADVQIVYEGERAKLYPWDRARDQLERAVASLKKSAREMGLDGMDAKLDALHAASWARVKAARAAALAQARSRVDGRGDIDDPQR
ncbi:PriCT-2 domain-containing protein [Burkholderia cenocepacia]|uniref:PriCT-2 domain-containing protein n=1 Tax=Burkholderia cenocepacia TaxID=95486 RepID=UPI00158C1A68|nr:PriCT-2 domain-containing protein [Burkholderia cenocepacia]